MGTTVILAALMLGGATDLTPIVRSPRAAVEASLAAINRHDADALAALYSEFAEVYASDACKPTVGPDAVRKGHEALMATMPDLSVEPTEWVVDGAHVAVLFTARSKAFPGGEMQLADFFTVRNGKIVKDVTVFNAGGPCK
jgi:hypothetical protein